MRHIRKGQEPPGLLKYRQETGATYDDPRNPKDEIREQLVREQGYLCCYCMKRITTDLRGMKIEHWAPQGDPSASHLQLDWKNLLGACKGNEGARWQDQHCDTRKGNAHLTLNPTDPSCELHVRYLGDGTIKSDDQAIDADLNHTLNLNHACLTNNRKAVLDALVAAMRRKYSNKPWPEDALKREITALQQFNSEGKLEEYCQVKIYWLRKRLGRSAQSGRA
jgi:uncharacterized protein (TIGR02646 family)